MIYIYIYLFIYITWKHRVSAGFVFLLWNISAILCHNVVACIYMDLICQNSSGSDHLWLHSEVGRNEGVGKVRLQGTIFVRLLVCSFVCLFVCLFVLSLFVCLFVCLAVGTGYRTVKCEGENVAFFLFIFLYVSITYCFIRAVANTLI